MESPERPNLRTGDRLSPIDCLQVLRRQRWTKALPRRSRPAAIRCLRKSAMSPTHFRTGMLVRSSPTPPSVARQRPRCSCRTISCPTPTRLGWMSLPLAPLNKPKPRLLDAHDAVFAASGHQVGEIQTTDQCPGNLRGTDNSSRPLGDYNRQFGNLSLTEQPLALAGMIAVLGYPKPAPKALEAARFRVLPQRRSPRRRQS